MAKNWALVVGINEYNPLNFAPLKYAKRDAERMRDYFQAADFEQVFFFSDDSPQQALPNCALIPTQATYGNLISFLQGFFKEPFLETGDNFWFFFAGHGEQYQDQDYLMPMDANAIGSEAMAALSVNYLRERLCRCGADNVILILDACRSEGSRSGPGVGEAQPGVITISSCQPTQKSWEVDELKQGVFTHALLEAMQLSGERSCATVEKLGNYLRQRVPELCQRHGKSPAQRPRVSADPLEKQHFILMPQQARQADIALLPDRKAETLATWLKEHPGVEILSRDRSKTYRHGMNEGAPTAIQVADRFHLLQNLEEALEKSFKGQSKALKTAEKAHLQAEESAVPPPSEPHPPRQLQKERKRAQRLANYEQAHALRKQDTGLKISPTTWVWANAPSTRTGPIRLSQNGNPLHDATPAH